MSKVQPELSLEQLSAWLKVRGYIYKSDGEVSRTLYEQAQFRVSHPNREDKDFLDFDLAVAQLRRYDATPIQSFDSNAKVTIRIFFPQRIGIRFETSNANDLKMLGLTKDLPARPSHILQEQTRYTLAEVEDILRGVSK